MHLFYLDGISDEVMLKVTTIPHLEENCLGVNCFLRGRAVKPCRDGLRALSPSIFICQKSSFLA